MLFLLKYGLQRDYLRYIKVDYKGGFYLMENFFNDYFALDFRTGLMNFGVALIILLVGWIVAKLIGNLVEKSLRKTNMDEKFFTKFKITEKPVDSNKIIGKVVYVILLIITVMLFFNQLNLTVLASPLSELITTFFSFIPAVVKAAIILIFAWIIASIVQWLIVKGTEKIRLQDLLGKLKLANTPEDVHKFMNTLGKVAFYLILLIFIPGVLDALNIAGVAQPFSGIVATILAFIPKLIAAALIFAVGFFVAKIIKNIIVNLLDAAGADKLVAKLKLKHLFESHSFASIVGNFVFIVIMIPITIASLEKLDLVGITNPAISMLHEIMVMIPNILIAIGLVLLGIWLGQLIGGFVRDYLGRLGFDRISSKMHIGNTNPSQLKMTPSAVVGYVVQVLIVFFLTVQALFIVKLDFLVTIASGITAYLPHVLAAVLILGVALIIANIVEKVLVNVLSGPVTHVLASFAKYTIVVLSIFMALTQLGIAPTIVNAAFILILGGLALAFGLAFGLGGKDFAAKYLRKFDKTIEETEVKESHVQDSNITDVTDTNTNDYQNPNQDPNA